jgi:protein-S-isoprenylcysteine O-methyltransferase Ste14
VKVFIPAAPRPAWQNVMRTVAQALVFWSVFIVGIPRLILGAQAALGIAGFEVALQKEIGVVGMVLMALINVWAGAVMAVDGEGTPFPADTARNLVVRGPYRVVRNPMAVGGLGFALALGFWMGSPLVMAYAVCGGLVWNVAARPMEERDLEARFGASYGRYRDAVRCWVPRLRPYRDGD